MKKLFLLSLAIYCFSFISAGAETKLFTGDGTPSLFSRMDIISWAMGETKDGGRYVNFGTDAEPAFTEVGNNPLKTGINKSDKALHMSALKGNSWWPNFLIMNLIDPITVTEGTRYLHIYHYRENLNKGFSVYLTDGTLPEDADKGTKRFDMNLSKPGTWEDVVVDLKWFIDNNQPLTAVSFLVDMNWGGDPEPATNYYFDEIVLNDSNLPRGINLFTEKEISFFPADNASYSKYVGSLDLQNTENTSEIVANPFSTQTAVLNSESIMKFSKSANASWWQGGPRFVLNGTLPVGVGGASAYLHVMVNIPEMEAGKDYYVVQLNAKDFSGKQIDSGDAIKYWTDDKGKWIDCVLDVTSLGYVSEFQVRFDVRKDDKDAYINSPAGVFYLDAAAINASADQRTEVKAPVGEKKLFTGDTTPSLFSRMDIIDWAMGETKDGGRYVNFGTADAPAFTEVSSNPDKTGLNKSDKALHMSALKGNSWWPNFLIMKLTDAITVTEETRYLHIYHYRENLNKGFSVYLTDGTLPEDADKGTKRFDMNLKQPATWEDIVVDLKWFIDNNQPLTAVSFLVDMNWGGDPEPATNYYWDEFALSSSNLPRGINIVPEKEILFFPGNNTSYTKWVGSLDLQNTENTSEIVANPFTTQTDVLNSTLTMKFNKSANASWWQGGPRFVLNGTLQVGVNGASSYLHVLVNIPEMEAGKDYYVVQLNAKDFAGKQIDSGDAIKYWADDKGKWIDCVLDVTSLGYVSELQVRFDVRKDDKDAYINSPAGTFYLDAVAINGNADPRTAVSAPTKITPSINKENTKIYSWNHNILVEGNVSTIEVYNLLGSLVKKVNATESRTEIPVYKSGVYLVRTVSANKNVFTSKVVVN
jgi:hypothetical protein